MPKGLYVHHDSCLHLKCLADALQLAAWVYVPDRARVCFVWMTSCLVCFVVSGQQQTTIWTTLLPCWENGWRVPSMSTTMWSGDPWRSQGESRFPQEPFSSDSVIYYIINNLSSLCQVLHRWVGSKALASFEVQPCDEAETGGAESCQRTMGWLHTSETNTLLSYDEWEKEKALSHGTLCHSCST